MYKLKRPVDFLISFVLLIVLFPVFILISILILINDGRPILFCQERPGLNNQIFKLYKFRSMKNKSLRADQSNDDFDRLFKIGKFLRSSSLDELPELWNVLKGEMSLVGPRPLLEEYLPLYNNLQASRHNVKPGITGWAQINGRNSISWDEKFKLDIWYIKNCSFLLDLKIICKTILMVFLSKDIDHDKFTTMKKFEGNINE